MIVPALENNNIFYSNKIDIELPMELRYEIYSYLNTEDLLKLRCVSKEMLEYIDDYLPELWVKLKSDIQKNTCLFSRDTKLVITKIDKSLKKGDRYITLFRKLQTASVQEKETFRFLPLNLPIRATLPIKLDDYKKLREDDAAIRKSFVMIYRAIAKENKMIEWACLENVESGFKNKSVKSIINEMTELSFGKKDLTETCNHLSIKIQEMKNLKYLDLSYTKITKIPLALKLLPDYCTINLSGNNIEEFPQDIETWKNKIILVLSETGIEKIPANFHNIINFNEENRFEDKIKVFLEKIPGSGH